MNDDQQGDDQAPQPVDGTESAPAATPKPLSETVGTGSYVAISCSVLAILATMVLIAGLLISRWLN